MRKIRALVADDEPRPAVKYVNFWPALGERLAAPYGDRATLEISNAEGGGVIATVRLPYHEASDA